MKKQKGITLIALIITIIVMLILVGVTINVALNGGLFKKAKTASEQTSNAVEKEILQNVALGYLNNNAEIDVDTFISECSGKDIINKYSLAKDGEYVKATKGTNEFYINKNGGILDQKPQATLTVLEDINNTLISQNPELVYRIKEGNIEIDYTAGPDNWSCIKGQLHTYYMLICEHPEYGIPLIYDNEVYIASLGDASVESIGDYEKSTWYTEGNITKQQILTDLNNALNSNS